MELDNVNEVLFFHKGSIDIGYEINKKKIYKLRFKEPNVLMILAKLDVGPIRSVPSKATAIANSNNADQNKTNVVQILPFEMPRHYST